MMHDSIQFEYYSMSENLPENNQPSILGKVEAILFVASAPVTPSQIGEALELDLKTVEETLGKLQNNYSDGRGISLQWHGGRVQLTSAPQYATQVEQFLGLEATGKLSKAAVETLTIIAYRQPITRPGIDSIRGVSSDGVIKSLLSKGLIQEVGRAEGPGRPILFATTAEFLQHFGLSSLSQLPPYEQPESDQDVKKNTILKD